MTTLAKQSPKTLIDCATIALGDLSSANTQMTSAFKYDKSKMECTFGRLPGYYGDQVHAITQISMSNDSETIYVLKDCYPTSKLTMDGLMFEN